MYIYIYIYIYLYRVYILFSCIDIGFNSEVSHSSLAKQLASIVFRALEVLSMMSVLQRPWGTQEGLGFRV